MQDLLWFLLPVAALSGWWAATKQQRKVQAQNTLNTEYYQGLNYLLNEQPDKAMDVFVHMMEVSSETVELHLALGSVFRRRGEVDRAIMLHQNLIARPTLDTQQRELALLELGQDFLAAGLLDRAERLFLELKQSKAHCQQSLKHLIAVYELEKDWAKAIEVAKQYEKVASLKQNRLIAHFLCEQALQSFAKGDRGLGAKLVKRAIVADSDCVRANIIMADDERKNGRYKAAIKTYMKVLDQDTAFVTEILPSVVECYEALGNEKKIPGMLDEIVGRYRPEQGMLLISRLFARFGTKHNAKELLSDFLQQYPSVKILASYMTVVDCQHDDANDIQENVKQALTKIVANGASYCCGECGFSGQALYWHCPSCKSWGSVKPI
jgi:lipopolysaccharide biosynthesis regulator YciM